MTIKRQRVNAGALVEVEADSTDTVDTGGFSDTLNVVGAKTAKFSNGDIMQANSNLRIGLTQLKINTGIEAGRNRDIESNSPTWNNPDRAIDDNTSTSATSGDVGDIFVIDFGSVSSSILQTELGCSVFDGGNTTIRVEISDDNISYTTIGTFIQSEGSKNLRDHGTQTWRYVRLTHTAETAPQLLAQVFRVFETQNTTSTTTIRVRSSATIDVADGTVIIPDLVLNPNTITVFDNDLLLTGDAQFITLEIVSITGFEFDINLQEITSIKEV